MLKLSLILTALRQTRCVFSSDFGLSTITKTQTSLMIVRPFLWLLQISVEWILQIRIPRSPYRTQSCVILLWQRQSFILTHTKTQTYSSCKRILWSVFWDRRREHKCKSNKLFRFSFSSDYMSSIVSCFPTPTDMLSPFCLQRTLFSSRMQAVSCYIV
jgi:hypothetical protein